MRRGAQPKPDVKVAARVSRHDVYALADRAREADRSFSAELRRCLRWYLEHGDRG